MFSFVCLCFFFTCVYSAPPPSNVPLEKQQPTVIPIISQSEEFEPNGTYKFSYETANGIKREETAYDKILPKARSAKSSDEGGESDSDESDEIHVQQGSYSYTAPDGSFISVRYIADENGFRPIGNHIPQAPSSEVDNGGLAKSGRALNIPDQSPAPAAPAIASRSAANSDFSENSPKSPSPIPASTEPAREPSSKAPKPTESATTPSNEAPKATESSTLLSEESTKTSETSATSLNEALKSTEATPTSTEAAKSTESNEETTSVIPSSIAPEAKEISSTNVPQPTEAAASSVTNEATTVASIAASDAVDSSKTNDLTTTATLEENGASTKPAEISSSEVTEASAAVSTTEAERNEASTTAAPSA